MGPPVVAVYDACVLFSPFLRDSLVQLAIHGRQSGLLRAKWTGRIHQEWMHAVLRERRHVKRANLRRTCRLMDEHVLGCRVHGYERWEARLTLPDEGDRHVLAAAIACAADVIVTHNTRDFPADTLSNFFLRAMTPDDFAYVFADELLLLRTAATEHRGSLKNPPQTKEEYLANMRRQSLPKKAQLLGSTQI